MTTRQKVAAKYVNVLDRVIDEPRTLVPLGTFITITTVRERVVDYDRTMNHRGWFDGHMTEWDDRTMGNLVQTGLQGE